MAREKSESTDSIPGIEAVYGIPPINIASRFFTSAGKYAELTAVGYAGDDAHLTYAQLALKVEQCATFLGPLADTEPVGLLSENRPEWVKTYLAILVRGGVVVPIDPALKEKELVRVFELSGINQIFVSSRCLEAAQNAAGQINRELIIIDLETVPDDTALDDQYRIPNDPHYPAVKIFTSGTTGDSKRVVLTHGNILSDLQGVQERLQFGPGDRFLSVLPLHHTLEATCGFMAPLLNGAAVYYIRELNSREIINGIIKHKITHFISVPLLYEKIYHSILSGVAKAGFIKKRLFGTLMLTGRLLEKVTRNNRGKKLFASFRRRARLDSLRLLVSGGAPLPREISQNFNRMGFPFVEGYGLTETSPVLSVNEPHIIRHGSVGRPLANVEIKIDNPDQKGIGELLVKGPMVMNGYEDNPELTAKVIRDGWFCTGDLARLDKDGYIYIVGRAKNLIVSAAGKNIYPEEIEAQLLTSRYILEAVIYGKKLPNGREEVAAMIYPDFEILKLEHDLDQENVSEDQLHQIIDPLVKQACSQLADYKRIKHIEYVRREMEKTSTRKIKRYKYQ